MFGRVGRERMVGAAWGTLFTAWATTFVGLLRSFLPRRQ
jgi:hypothetical protein